MNLFKFTLLLHIIFWTAPVESAWNDVKTNVAEAAHVTNMDVQELAAVGYLESSFRPSVKAKRGSAVGLMQITKPTWRHLVKTYGEAYDITMSSSRKDPTVNAIMAAAYLKESRTIMEKRMGRKVTTLEVYLGHKFGPYRATNLLKTKRYVKLVDFYPGAASRNHSVYYNDNGTAKTIGDVIAMFDKRLRRALDKYGDLAVAELAKVKAREFAPFALAALSGETECIRTLPNPEEILAEVGNHRVKPTRLSTVLEHGNPDTAENYFYYMGYAGCAYSGRKWRGHLV